MNVRDILNKHGLEEYSDVPNVNLDSITTEDDGIQEEFDNISELEKATVAVESYLGLLNRPNVYITSELAHSVKIGLEHICPNLFEDDIIALENFPVTEEEAENIRKVDKAKDTQNTKVKKGLWEKLKSLVLAGIKALGRAIEMLSNFYRSVTQNLPKLIEKIENLIDAFKSVDDNVNIKAKGLNRLSIDGQFKGNDPKAFTELRDTVKVVLDELNQSHLDNVTEWFDKANERIKKISLMNSFIVDKEEANKYALIREIVELIDLNMKPSLGPMRKLEKVTNTDLVPSGFSDAPKFIVTIRRLGREMEYDLSSDFEEGFKKAEEPLGLAKTKDGFGNKSVYVSIPSPAAMAIIGFYNRTALVTDDNVTEFTGDTVGIDKGKAIDCLKESISILKLLDSLERIRKAQHSEVERIRSENIKEIKKILSSYFGVGRELHSGTSVELMLQLRNQVNNIIKISTETQYQFTGYVINCIRYTLALYENVIKASGKDVIK